MCFLVRYCHYVKHSDHSNHLRTAPGLRAGQGGVQRREDSVRPVRRPLRSPPHSHRRRRVGSYIPFQKPASCCMLKSLAVVFQQIVGRSEVLSGVFYLLSFLAYHRASAASGTNLGFLALSVLSFLLSSFSKEAGVTVLAVNALWDLLNNCRFLDLVTQRPTDADR